jgi:hypothetical protein
MKMKNLKLVFTIGLLALITSCSKSKDEVIAPTLPVVKPDPSKTADVYVAGWKYNSKLAPVATLWKNGVATELTDGTTNLARAYAVYVSGTDTYVAGKDGLKSVLWKNGIATVLSSELYSSAYSVFVSGTDVYVAGSTDGLAAIWKNGVAVKLTSGPKFSTAYSVFVSGTDVYATGYEYMGEDGKSVATLWKNGVATRLSDGTKQAVAKAVFVSGTDVYVISDESINPEDRYTPGNENAGTTPIPKSVVKIWKNGVADNLTDGTKQAVGNSVFVNNGDIYVAGYENDGTTCTARVWKNKTGTSLASGLYAGMRMVAASSVFVNGNDVYAVVNDGGTAKTWKNLFAAEEINVGGGGATALSVFVK